MLKLDNTKLNLDKIVSSQNIAEDMNKDELKKIAVDVCVEYTKDKDSRMKWEHQVKKVIKLASLEHERKDTPFQHASNVKQPIIATACLRVAAEMLPFIVRDGEVVHTSVVGDDPDNSKHEMARVIADHMNYQLLVESGLFENGLDKLTHAIPLIGMGFQKVYYSPIKRVNVIETIPYDRIFLNADIPSMEEARRITHKIDLHKNDLIERMRYGTYLELEDEKLDVPPIGQDGSNLHVILEQHRYLDLDDDGYEEPYIVTVLEATQDVLRIVARWDSNRVERNAKNKIQCIHPIHYFVDYHCLPNPDGSYYSIGLGQLLYGANRAINSLMNQAIDAGTLSNLQTGIVGRGFRIKGGELKMKPGALIKVDTAIQGKLSDEIHMMDYKPPSPVLLQLLDLVMTGADKVSSTTDVTTGNAQVQNVASSVMATQQQNGSRLTTGMQRRTFRSLKKLFEAIYYLNSIYLDPQSQFMMPGKNQPISLQDYQQDGISVKPVADPDMASDIQRMHISQQLIQLLENPQATPFLNGFGVIQQAVEDMKVRNPQQVLKPPDPNAPPPPEVLKMQSDMQAKAAQTQLDAHKLDLQQQDVLIRAHLAESEVMKNHANSTLMLAQASAAGKAPALQQHQQAVDALMAGHKNEMDLQKEKLKGDNAIAMAKAKPKPTSGA